MTMQTAFGYLRCKIKKNWDVDNDNADSSRLFTMQYWKESSDVNNDNADSSSLIYNVNLKRIRCKQWQCRQLALIYDAKLKRTET